MKKRISLVLSLVLVLSLALTACGEDEKIKVAKDFNKALVEADTEGIKAYCTEEFADQASLVASMFALMETEGEESKITYEASNYKVEDEKDEEATVVYNLKFAMDEEEEEGEAKIFLKKVDGKWLVNGAE